LLSEEVELGAEKGGTVSHDRARESRKSKGQSHFGHIDREVTFFLGSS
jgi:hypothetical protein